MAMPTKKMKLNEMKAKHIFSCTDHLIEALITPLSLAYLEEEGNYFAKATNASLATT